MDRLRDLMTVPPDAEEYLTSHEFLVAVVIDAHDALRKEFPTDKFRLEVVHDMEDDSPEGVEGQLCLYIDTEGDPSRTFAKLTHFDTDWWYENMPRAQGKFFVNVGFV